MAKRMHEQKGEEKIVTKSKSTTMILTSSVSTSFSSAKDLIAAKDTEILKVSTAKLDAKTRRNSKSDGASNSQKNLLVSVASRQ